MFSPPDESVLLDLKHLLIEAKQKIPPVLVALQADNEEYLELGGTTKSIIFTLNNDVWKVTRILTWTHLMVLLLTLPNLVCCAPAHSLHTHSLRKISNAIRVYFLAILMIISGRFTRLKFQKSVNGIVLLWAAMINLVLYTCFTLFK
jgi:hypothetical protein